MTIFLFSLAGIPPLAGWFAKFVMFRAGVRRGTPRRVVLGVDRRGELGGRVLLLRGGRPRDVVPRPGARGDRAAPQPIPSRSTSALGLRAAIVLVVGVYPQVVRPHRRARVHARADATVDRRDPTRDRWRSGSAGTGRSRSARSSRPRSTTRRRLLHPRAAAPGAPARDFVTSPEVGPLFGALRRPCARRVVARPRATRSVRRGRGRRGPRPAGRATCSRAAPDVRAGAAVRARRAVAARCAPTQRELLAARAVRARRSARSIRGDRRTTPEPVAGIGPDRHRARRAAGGAVDGVVLANELLDNLPFRVVERTADGWSEVRVAVDGDGLVEVLVPAPTSSRPRRTCRRRECGARRRPSPGADRDRELAARVCGGAPPRRARADRLRRRPPRSWSQRGEAGWLRTYREHERGDAPLVPPASRTSPATCRSSTSCMRPRLPASGSERTRRRRSGCGRSASTSSWPRRAADWDARAARRRPRGASGPQPRHRGRGAHRSRRPRRPRVLVFRR